MSKKAPKSEKIKSDPEELTGVIPNLVTHVASSKQTQEVRDEALLAIVGAIEREMLSGRQFYALPIGQTWGVFYNGQVQVH